MNVLFLLMFADEHELKTLVDLALINGQSDLDITKVSCLHAAVTSFSPLIYNLKENSGFDKFYHQCRCVWRDLESDPHLMTKLVRNLAREFSYSCNKVK